VDDFRQRFNRTFKESGMASDRQSVFVPTIVTNAPIYVTRYPPSEISLATAEFLQPPKDIRRVPCVRFRKSFTSESVLDLGERSVFVVNAAAFYILLSPGGSRDARHNRPKGMSRPLEAAPSGSLDLDTASSVVHPGANELTTPCLLSSSQTGARLSVLVPVPSPIGR
jgi:hypothetical protein